MVPADIYFGRRLMQRQFDYPDSLDKALVDHPIQQKYKYGILPFSLRDFTGRCYILSSLGACKPEDFAASMYSRQIESEEVCHKLQPGNDNPLCVQLSTTREDTVSSMPP